MQAKELLYLVILYKGRVWTVYSSWKDGVHCYQGLKPFASFDYEKDSWKYRTYRKMTTFVKMDEVVLLEGDEIEKAMKRMETEDKKKLTCKKAIDFYVHLTGHTKAFVSKHIEEHDRTFDFSPGCVWYQLWKMDGALYLSHNMDGSSHHVNYDFITFEPHDVLNEKRWEDIKNEIIDNYKDWKGIS